MNIKNNFEHKKYFLYVKSYIAIQKKFEYFWESGFVAL